MPAAEAEEIREREKRLPEIQKRFTPEDTKSGIIEQWIADNIDQQGVNGFICVPMVYQKALGNSGLPKQWESKEIASILDGLKGKDGKRILRRHGKDGTGVHIFKEPAYYYGRQRAWILSSEQRASEQNRASEQFLPVPEGQQMEIPFEN